MPNVREHNTFLHSIPLYIALRILETDRTWFTLLGCVTFKVYLSIFKEKTAKFFYIAIHLWVLHPPSFPSSLSLSFTFPFFTFPFFFMSHLNYANMKKGSTGSLGRCSIITLASKAPLTIPWLQILFTERRWVNVPESQWVTQEERTEILESLWRDLKSFKSLTLLKTHWCLWWF